MAKIFAESNITASVTIEVCEGLVDIPTDGFAVFKVINVEELFVANKIAFSSHYSGSAATVASHGFHIECGSDVSSELHVDDLVINDGIIVAEDALTVLAVFEGFKDSGIGAVVRFNVSPPPKFFIDINISSIVDARFFDRAAVGAVNGSIFGCIFVAEVFERSKT